jgi:predicted alpha/beta superfamily hydrolase
VKSIISLILISTVVLSAHAGSKGLRVKYGQLKRISGFRSQYVETRNFDVWTPKGYDPKGKKQYNVLYMHDGQNLFIPKLSTWGITWKVDSTVTRLLKKKLINSCIVVGIWKTDKRYPEYMPEKPYRTLSAEIKNTWKEEFSGEPVSDNYLKFIVNELKPHIDSTYRTYPDKAHTFIAGSSMGGVISLYAVCEYPEVFGGAACLSTHWPGSHKIRGPEIPAAFAEYVETALPRDHSVKFYFDYGTKTLDSLYEPFQKTIDSIMTVGGYTEANWVTRKFEGAEHNERSWAKRLEIPLRFLLGK